MRFNREAGAQCHANKGQHFEVILELFKHQAIIWLTLHFRKITLIPSGRKTRQGKTMVREIREILVQWSMRDGIPGQEWCYLHPLWVGGDCLISYYPPRDSFFYSLRHLWARFLCKPKYLASQVIIGNGEYWSSTSFLKLRAISNTVYLNFSKSNIVVISKTMLSLQVYVTGLSFTPSSVANSNKNIDISLLI